MIMSSPQAIHIDLILFVSFTAFGFVWCELLSKSFIYRLKKMELKGQPCRRRSFLCALGQVVIAILKWS